MERSTTVLGYALLGLVHQKPRTGYDLRKIFAETPLVSFSESPGSIYPALRRLEERNLIRGNIEEGAGMRRRKVFHLTPQGLNEFKEWLAGPIQRENVIRGADELMLRFAFMDRLFPKTKIVGFLKDFEVELSSYVASLKNHLAEQSGDLTFTGRAALEAGIELYQARIRWARRVVATLRPGGG